MPTKKDIARQHAQTVRRLLAAEAAAHALLKPTVATATARIKAAVSGVATNPRQAVLSAIRIHGGTLRKDAQAAVLTARQRARDLGNEQLLSDLGPLRRWASRNLQAEPLPVGIVPHAAELDAFEASRAASSIETAWSSNVLANALRWERKGDKGPIADALDVTRALQPKLDRHAATQAASAFGDERQGYWDQVAAAQVSPDDGGSGGIFGNQQTPAWAPALFHTWSAVLDRRTCDECAALDGSTVPIDEDFADGAECPLHPSCRCIILTTFDEDSVSGSDDSDMASVGEQVRGASLLDLVKNF